MIFSATLVFVMERKLISAGCWMLAAAVLSGVGLIHGWVLTPLGLENEFGWLVAPAFFWSYLSVGVVLIGLGLTNQPKRMGFD